jgi:hypothetical protein
VRSSRRGTPAAPRTDGPSAGSFETPRALACGCSSAGSTIPPRPTVRTSMRRCRRDCGTAGHCVAGECRR